MTAWRWPTPQEQRDDFRNLRGVLDSKVAVRIAAMPCVVVDPEASAPFTLRADAWLWRTARRLDEHHQLRVRKVPR